MTKTINVSLPPKLLEKIDAAARGEYATRSDFIRETLVRRIKGQRIVDEWGDEGEWETVVDFRDLPGGGMPAEEFSERLKKLNGQNK
ncbi:MAG: ribbon-helix-helix domain-containing protein [Candidatus Saccharimonadales bacterium]